MTRGTIQEFLEAAAGTAGQVFGEPTQRVAHRGGAATPELKRCLPFGVGIGDRVGERRARPRGFHPVLSQIRFLPPAVDRRTEHGRRRQDAGR